MTGERKAREAITRWVGAALPLAAIVAATWALWLRFNAPPGALSGRALGIALHGDLVNYYLGTTERVARRLAAGEVPLWNPEGCSGIPLLATLQAGVFYPGNWLALLVPAHVALSLLAFLQCALGGFFALWLFRSWGCGSFTAAACALVFVFKCCLGQILWPPKVASVVWLPWLLLCVEKLCRTPSAGWWAGLALGCAVQILAGFPQYVLYTHLVVVPYAGVRLLEQALAGSLPWTRVVSRAGAIAAALFLGVGLAGAQLLPTLELVSQSARSEALQPEEVHYLNIWFVDSLRLLASSFDPSPGDVAYEYRTAGYLGAATLLALVLAPVLGWREPRTWLLLALGAAALVLSDGHLGRTRTLYEAISRLPFFGSLRTPERLRFVTFFCAIGLAAIAFAAIERARTREARLRLGAIVPIPASGIALGMIGAGQGTEAWRVAIAAALLLALGARTRWLHLGAGPLLVAFVATDLALATRETGSLRGIPAALAEVYHDGATGLSPGLLAAHRRRVGGARLELLEFRPFVATGASAGLRRAACYEPLVPSQWAELHRKFTGEPTRGANLLGLDPEEHATFYDVMSVRQLIRSGPAGKTVVLRNDDALPRAFVLPRYRIASRDAALDHVARGDLDFRRVVLVDRDPGFETSAAEDGAALPSRIVEDAPERVVVEAQAPTNSLLVLTDGYYPGWEVRVDGERAEILMANGLHRAVPIAAGRHRVVFEYRPRSFRLGAALSLLSLGGLAAVLAASRWSRTGG